MLLGTGSWAEGPAERRALVGRLASGRLADLNRIEALRLGKLGEGDPTRLAEALVPPSLRRLLEGGPRALARATHTLAYAEKWDLRGNLPEALAPMADQVRLGPCLPRPLALHRFDGGLLDRLTLGGPGAELNSAPQPSLGVVGAAGGAVAGFCLAFDQPSGTVLGAWLSDQWPAENMELKVGNTRRSVPLKAWENLVFSGLRAGEVLLFPPPRLKPFPELPEGAEVSLSADFDQLVVGLGAMDLPTTIH